MNIRDEKGATLVEATIALPLLIFLIFGFIQLSLMAYTSLALTYTLNECTRVSILGRSDVSLTRYEINRNFMQDGLKRFQFLDVDSLEFNMCDEVKVNCNEYNAGTSNGYVYVKASMKAPNLFGNYNINVSASSMMKNEPF